MDIKEVSQRSAKIRQRYHKLELKYHGSEWNTEEDALAFLTDAGIVGRLVMDQQGRWPKTSGNQLNYKIGECIWWFSTLADQTGLSLEDCISHFRDQREKDLK